MRSTKDFKLKLTKGSLDGAAGTFRGLASVYNNVDLGNDAVEPGAFKKTLEEQGDGFPLLWQHTPAMPIGKARLTDSALGLVADGQLVMSVPQAQSAYDFLKAGVIRGLSIGYDVIRETVDSSGVRHLLELKLWEVSLVTFPMNQSALVTSVKSIDDARRVLSEAAAHPEDAETIAAVRSLLKDITQLLTPAGECECGADDAEDCTCEEDAEDEKQAAHILQELAFELKGHTATRTPLRW
jgi:Escherichia/Staphylococcus phage prohead protease